MTTYLDSIIERKYKELAAERRQVDIEEIFAKLPSAPAPLPFAESLRRGNGIIAEFKRRSPSRGDIHAGISPADVVGGYSAAGVSAVSCLTDSGFGGSLADLREAVGVATVPVLCKDFFVAERQVLWARACGASAILLIAAVLTIGNVRVLSELARSYGMDVILEVHDEADLKVIVDSVTVVGVNSRDLRTFEVDPDRAARLAEALPSHLPRVAESGIRGVDDLVRLRRAGFDGFLVGEALMARPDPAEACRRLCHDFDRALRGEA